MHLIKRGSLFNSEMQTLVNPVNCVGVMGAGLALSFKNRFPDMFLFYRTACAEGRIAVGKPLLYVSADEKIRILLFPTKKHWKDPSETEYVISGLDYFVRNYDEMGITSAAFPALGCGYGGLSWNEVLPIMAERLRSVPVPIEIYRPNYFFL